MAIIYKLKHPVEFGSDTIEELELKRPNAERMVKYKLSMDPEKMYEAKTWFNFVCAYSHGVTEAVIKKLEGDDLQGAFEEVTELF